MMASLRAIGFAAIVLLVGAACSSFEGSADEPTADAGQEAEPPDAAVDARACPRPGAIVCEDFDDGLYANRWTAVTKNGAVTLVASPISAPNALAAEVFANDAGAADADAPKGPAQANLTRIVSRGASKGIVVEWSMHIELLAQLARTSAITVTDANDISIGMYVSLTPGLSEIGLPAGDTMPFQRPDDPWVRYRLELDLVAGTGSIRAGTLVTEFKGVTLPADLLLIVGPVVYTHIGNRKL
jgi:hypothetical protein